MVTEIEGAQKGKSKTVADERECRRVRKPQRESERVCKRESDGEKE